jgi:hypothetical protein
MRYKACSDVLHSVRHTKDRSFRSLSGHVFWVGSDTVASYLEEVCYSVIPAQGCMCHRAPTWVVRPGGSAERYGTKFRGVCITLKRNMRIASRCLLFAAWSKQGVFEVW